ncbi:MAG: bacillithiol biosynthesis deacetylase BshB1 [Bacteroidetes bacterium]|nr:bacillithiol biosynthesis deacetylase BshB1 [Bacteroidota bacterium]
MKLDILVFAAHPDDAELSCSGTILKHIELGYKVGIVDLTRGELGTRGTPELRAQEAAKASEILGIHARHNLGLADGFFRKDQESLLRLIEMIRLYKPEIVLCNAEEDRHVDHGRGGDLAEEACFLSGLRKINSSWNGQVQEAWRPKAVYHYIQDRMMKPDIVVDISPYFDKKLESIMAFSSQFYNPDSLEPETPISGENFIEFIKGRANQFGRILNVKYGEGFTVKRAPGISDLVKTL